MTIPPYSVLNSGDKESNTQKFTKPLRAVLGGKKVSLVDNKSPKKLYSTVGRIGMGAILFTIGIPYTIVAGGILAGKAFKKGSPKMEKPMPKTPSETAEIPKKESEVEEPSSPINKFSKSEESIEIKSKENDTSSKSQSSKASEHSSSSEASEDYNPLEFFNLHLLTPSEKKEQAEKIITMAEQGDARAQYMVGMAIHNSNIKRNLELPDKPELSKSDFLNYMEKAADQGYRSAQLEMGNHYASGKYIPKDSAKAIEYYMSCIEDASDPTVYAEASYHLGKCYQEGDGVAKNDGFAHTHFQNAAEKNDVDAQYETAMYFKNGNGFMKKDYALAFKNFQLASDKDHPEARMELGICYQYGRGGAPKNADRAFQLFQEAADLGSSEAKMELGNCYKNSIGTPKNDKEALRLYSEAAEEGLDRAANYAIAELYLEGRGGNDHKPLNKAIDFFETTADNSSLTMLFNIYKDGIPGIIDKNPTKAAEYENTLNNL